MPADLTLAPAIEERAGGLELRLLEEYVELARFGNTPPGGRLRFAAWISSTRRML